MQAEERTPMALGEKENSNIRKKKKSGWGKPSNSKKEPNWEISREMEKKGFQ